MTVRYLGMNSQTGLSITEHEVTRLEASDLILFAGKVVGFLSPSSAR